MIDKGAGVLEQYDLLATRTLRGRGATIIETDKGYRRIIEYSGAYSRLEYENALLNYICKSGFENVDYIVPNKEGSLFSLDMGGIKHIVTNWFYGSECDVKSQSCIYESVKNLAALHNILFESKFDDCSNLPISESLEEEYKKHNLELKRVRTYIRGRKRKSGFEYDVLRHFEEFYECAMEVSELIKQSEYDRLHKEAKEKASICHGNYNYHNILFDKGKVAIVNFERSAVGVQISDLYLFLRKVMEKYDWDVNVGHGLIEAYDSVKTISDKEYELLKVMIHYPEKFWKIVNHYYNSNKSWIPDKNVEKLNRVYHQQQKKEKFIRSM